MTKRPNLTRRTIVSGAPPRCCRQFDPIFAAIEAREGARKRHDEVNRRVSKFQNSHRGPNHELPDEDGYPELAELEERNLDADEEDLDLVRARCSRLCRPRALERLTASAVVS